MTDDGGSPGAMHRFRGQIRTGPFGWHGTWPFGRLEFDAEHLRIWGLGRSVLAHRHEVRTVRLRSYLLTTQISVVFDDGSESSVRFGTGAGGTIAACLREHGWPISIGGPGAPPKPGSWRPLLRADEGPDSAGTRDGDGQIRGGRGQNPVEGADGRYPGP